MADLEANACVCVWMESGGGGDLVCKEDQKNENEIGLSELERKILGIEEKQRPPKNL